MTEEQLMQIYGMLLAQAFQGSTPSNQLNLVQDVLGTAGVSFMPQQPDYPIPDFQIDPETGQPIGVTESVYGNNPAWQGVFNKIDQGETPEAAVSAAINQGVFTELDKNDANAVNNYIRIGRDYATERFENAQRLANFQTRTQQAEAGVGVSLQDLMNPPTSYDRLSAALGKPDGATAEDFMRAYAQQRAGAFQAPERPGRGRTLEDVRAGRPIAQTVAPVQSGGPTFRGSPTTQLASSGVSVQAPASAAMRTSARGGGKSAATTFGKGQDKAYDPFTANDDYGRAYRRAFQNVVERHMGLAKNVAAPSPQAQQAQQTIALLGALLGGR